MFRYPTTAPGLPPRRIKAADWDMLGLQKRINSRFLEVPAAEPSQLGVNPRAIRPNRRKPSMRKRAESPTGRTAGLMMAAAFVVGMLSPTAMLAQQAPQQPAPPKPYKTVPITLPKPVADPSFEAFRKQIADIAEKKD